MNTHISYIKEKMHNNSVQNSSDLSLLYGSIMGLPSKYKVDREILNEETDEQFTSQVLTSPLKVTLDKS